MADYDICFYMKDAIVTGDVEKFAKVAAKLLEGLLDGTVTDIHVAHVKE